jgi:uncharacterized protein YjeT (DUF2065 family)
MTTLLTAIAFVLIFEGLVFALAPMRLETILKMLSELKAENRRLIGLASLACGVAMLWILHFMGVA